MFVNYYDKKYANKMGPRRQTFRKIFKLLESKQKNFYVIVETGCARTRDNFLGDGMSTVLFDEFVNFYDGAVFSVDKEKGHCDLANSLTSNKTTVNHSDSVPFLWNLCVDNDIDLVYLDSYDIDFNNSQIQHLSMLHHLKEFCAILPKLKEGAIIAIDDNRKDGGKGHYVRDFMNSINKKPIINDVQLIYIL